MRWVLILFFLALAACTDDGAVRQDQKVLPNEDPTTYYETVDQTEISSTRAIKTALAETREAEINAVEAEETPPPSPRADPPAPEPKDLRHVSRDEQQERLKTYRDALAGRQNQGPYSPPKSEPDPITPRQIAKQPTHPQNTRAGTSPPKAKPQVRPAGGMLFPVTVGQSNRLKPGELFLAQLIGRVNVSSLAPFVLVEIFDPQNHRPLGRAIGRATLHPVEKSKALLTFNQIYLDGEVINGRLVGLDMELSEGLRGRLHAGNFRKLLQAFANTFLAALSLELDAGDTLGQIFQLNFSKSLIDQAQGHLSGLDTARVVTLERGTQFWVMSEAVAAIDAKAEFRANPGFTTAVENAFSKAQQQTGLSVERNQRLMDAYRKLSSKLDQLP